MFPYEGAEFRWTCCNRDVWTCFLMEGLYLGGHGGTVFTWTLWVCTVLRWTFPMGCLYLDGMIPHGLSVFRWT
jgi:hypothetical protein